VCDEAVETPLSRGGTKETVMRRKLLATAFAAATLIGSVLAGHAADAVRIGYQTNVEHRATIIGERPV
jgi:hypothetical protein